MTKRIEEIWADLPNEEWRIYPSDPRFYVSSFGRVRFKHRAPKTIRPRKNGYYYVCSTLDRAVVIYSVAGMVAEAFKGSRPIGYTCSHLDGNPGNNFASNIAWETHSDNCMRKGQHGTAQCGERNGFAKLTADEVKFIRTSSLSSRQIAPAFGLSHGYVRRLRNKESWKHV